MKTPLTLLALTFAASLMFSGIANVAGADNGSARGGAAGLVKSAPATVAVQSQPLSAHCAKMQPQDCSSCETVRGTQTVTDGKMSVARTVAVEKHLCGACKTSIDSTGHGKAQQLSVSHACKMAAEQSKNCCVR